MAEDQGQDKTHQPTERQKQKFRERGEIPKSKDVVSAVGLGATVLALLVTTGPILDRIREVFLLAMQPGDHQDLDIGGTLVLLEEMAVHTGVAVVMPLCLVMAAGVGASALQTRLNIPKEPIKFRWDVLNLPSAFKQKFLTLEPLVELVKGILLITVISALLWLAMKDRIETLPLLARGTTGALLVELGDMALLVATRALPVALLVAALDYAHQWRKLNEKMKMSHRDLKDEHKEMEGDPHMKAARRARARQIAMARTIQEVKRADLVITNPTHYAVALRYRTSEAPAPVVVAKGVDHMAEKIKAEAARHDIPKVENRPLARALHASGKEGSMIPEQFYGPVAKVLAAVIRRKRVKGGQAHS